MRVSHLLFLGFTLCAIQNRAAADSIAFSGITAHLPGTIQSGTAEFMPNKLDSSGILVYNLEVMYTKEMSSIVIKGGYLKDSFNDNAALLVVANKDFLDEKDRYFGYGAGMYVRETFHVTKDNVEYTAVTPGELTNGHYDMILTPGFVGGVKLCKDLTLEFVSNIILNNVSMGFSF